MTHLQTITQIKDAVAQRHGFQNWIDLYDSHAVSTCSYEEIEQLENEAIFEVANHFCKLQRESDNAKAKLRVQNENEDYTLDTMTTYAGSFVTVDSESILTNPLVTEQ